MLRYRKRVVSSTWEKTRYVDPIIDMHGRLIQEGHWLYAHAVKMVVRELVNGEEVLWTSEEFPDVCCKKQEDKTYRITQRYNFEG